MCGCFAGVFFEETFWAPPHKTVKISHSFMFRRWCGGRMSVARGRCACPVEPVLVPECLNGLYGLVCVYNCCWQCLFRLSTQDWNKSDRNYTPSIPFKPIFPHFSIRLKEISVRHTYPNAAPCHTTGSQVTYGTSMPIAELPTDPTTATRFRKNLGYCGSGRDIEEQE